MPLVRNPSGRECVVPAGHWALEDAEFTVLPDEPQLELAAEVEPKAPARKRPAK